ncbi:MAG: hypothetical protein LKF42_08830 [Streptococcaceae bacterium]|nr:hypothetical protein [Streptococcaceae bacterium]MCH4177272.1 hypothetical protein [Streptococcaceae bacterium]
MDLTKIYRIEILEGYDEKYINQLLKNGWVLIDTGRQAFPEHDVRFVIGATKNIYKKYNLDNAKADEKPIF